ncbi:CaiB Predicted acyl-CoA transferases/carnitine dehydratase [Burkholderiales bacterium]
MLALSELKVLEMGQLIAGPFCAKTLGDFGAQVTKIEPPEGDPLRRWRVMRGDTSLWWHVQSRNKRSIAIDLRQPQGQALAKQLALQTDVLIENFSPGTLEKWGMSYETLSAENPGLIMVRISGFGQTGPRRDSPGFGVVGEAMGGLRHLSGEPGRKPVRVGVSIGDTLAALHGVIGIFAALEARRKTGRGQVIDVALHESVFNVMESLLPEYTEAGVVREPAGSALPGITPSNAYPCSDGLVLVAGNGDGIFKRLMEVMGRLDLRDDPSLADNAGRNQRASEIDDAIAKWTQARDVETVIETLQAVRVPVGRIYTAKDIAEDDHYRAREMILKTEAYDGLPVHQPGVVPKLSETPGQIRSRAPRIGEHTETVLLEAGLSEAQINQLRLDSIITQG